MYTCSMKKPAIDHPVVSVRNVTVRYPGQRHLAIDGISFDISSGTINTLLGPNGSGKSTVIKSILGFVEYEGEIDVLGRDVQEVYSQIGYVPQFKEFDASFPITVEEFLGYSLVNTKHPKDWREHQVSDEVDGEWNGHPPGHLASECLHENEPERHQDDRVENLPDQADGGRCGRPTGLRQTVVPVYPGHSSAFWCSGPS